MIDNHQLRPERCHGNGGPREAEYFLLYPSNGEDAHLSLISRHGNPSIANADCLKHGYVNHLLSRSSREVYMPSTMYTVFDLISGLFAYVIFGKKNALISEPPLNFFFFFCKYCQRALCNFLYLLYTLSASIPGAKL